MKIAIILMLLLTIGCSRESQIASKNLSKAAEEFKIVRRVVFYNGITGDYILSIKGRCSVDTGGKQLAVTCKVEDRYKKHYLGLSDNVTYFAEQLNSQNVSGSRYKVIFRPSSIVPDIDVK